MSVSVWSDGRASTGIMQHLGSYLCVTKRSGRCKSEAGDDRVITGVLGGAR